MDVMAFHRDTWVVDAHVHGQGMLPRLPRAAYRAVNRTTMPPDADLAVLRAGGVDLAVAKAVGDPAVTRWYRKPAFDAVRDQLASLSDQAAAAGVRVVLGLEGADAVGSDVDNVDRLHDLGVRVVGLIHLNHNQFGTTSMPWHQYVGPFPSRRPKHTGLTPLGAKVVDRLNALGIVIDVAHADAATTFDVVDRATGPVISSHAGAAAVDPKRFARFLSDDELRAVASTGGVVGLWPYNHRGRGVPTMAALVDHARYIADLVGPQHLCIGTDLNGVPGLMAGYRGEGDLPLITEALVAGGFAEADVRGLLGANIGRVLGVS